MSRLFSNSAYTGKAVGPSTAAALLQRYCEHPRHHFWESPTAAEPRLYQRALGHRHVNDVWMVELARQRHRRLVTFDEPLKAHDAGGTVVQVIS